MFLFLFDLGFMHFTPEVELSGGGGCGASGVVMPGWELDFCGHEGRKSLTLRDDDKYIHIGREKNLRIK